MATVKYTQDHEWVRPDGGTAVVGITVHAQDALVTYKSLSPELALDLAQPLGEGRLR